MKTQIIVCNSDAVNLYDMKFTAKALESGLNQTWEYGTPSFITHDWHRPFAWAKSLCLVIEPGLIRSVGLLYFPENDEESKFINESLQGYLNYKIQKNIEPFKDKLLSKLESHLTSSFKYNFVNCAAVVDEKLALKVFPELFENKDKDGLIDISLLDEKSPGFFEYKGLLLSSHEYFRRSQSRLNSINTPFFAAIRDIEDKENLKIKIAIDEDFIGLPESLENYFELEYWWGPTFDNDLSKIPYGVTHHEADDNVKMFHGITGTEFGWYEQNGIRSFTCEELKDIPSYGIGNNYFSCRFVHSQIHDDNNIHLDGAVRLYDETKMIERLDVDLFKSKKDTDYTKLWRIDGYIPLKNWKEIISHYFRDNHLIGEYFGGIDSKEKERPYFINNDQNVLEKYIPINFELGQGVILSVSYHSKTNSLSNNRQVIAKDCFSKNGNEFYYIDADSIELFKLFKISGIDYHIDDDILLAAFEDLAINFPLILHTGESSVDQANLTHSIIMEFCNSHYVKDHNRIISYNIGIEYTDKEVYFSFIGNVNDIVSLHSKNEILFPENTNDIGSWIEEKSKLFTETFVNGQVINLDHILKKSGILLLDRIFIPQDMYDLKYDKKIGLQVDLIIEEENKSLIEIIESKQLEIAKACIIKRSICSNCKDLYTECLCSKIKDENIVQRIEEIDFLGLFWTNRKA